MLCSSHLSLCPPPFRHHREKAPGGQPNAKAIVRDRAAATRTSRTSQITPKLSGKGWVCAYNHTDRLPTGRTAGSGLRAPNPPAGAQPRLCPCVSLAAPPQVLFLISSPPFEAHPASQKGRGDVGQRTRHSFPYDALKPNSQAMCISPRHWKAPLLPVSLVSALLPVAPLSVSDYGERACLLPFCTPQPHQEFIP